MTQAYTEWLKRPKSERNTEAATAVMGWTRRSCGGEPVWNNHNGDVERDVEQWSPCTDRNATDILLAEVGRLGLTAPFCDLLDEEVSVIPGTDEGRVALLRAPASLLTWAACEACKEEAHG
jgi:hypothetical protein